MNKIDERQKRIELINNLLIKISLCGRKFFLNKNGVCRFELINNKPRYIDTYHNHIIYPYGRKDYKFSSGGTLWELVKEFREWIMTGGKPVDCSGLYVSYWGYPEEDMKVVREYAKKIGYLA